TAARDYEAFEGAWSGYPLRARMLAGRLRRAGALVLESDPPGRFADPAQAVPLSPGSIRWASVLSSPVMNELEAIAPEQRTPESSGTIGFRDVIRSLRS